MKIGPEENKVSMIHEGNERVVQMYIVPRKCVLYEKDNYPRRTQVKTIKDLKAGQKVE